MKRDLVSIGSLSKEEILELFELAEKLKNKKNDALKGKVIALIFEKPSLRTRVTFHTAMTHLGGDSIYLTSNDIKLGERESIKDVARNLSRWVQGIVARTYKHETVEELAQYADIPVINGLSDEEHPCQALGDFLTIKEIFGRVDIRLGYVGDGNNVCNSLLLGGGLLGTKIRVASPKGYEPKEVYIKKAREFAKSSNAEISITNHPIEAVKDADIVYTDVWASMGQEAEREVRKKIFENYQVNSLLLKYAKENCKFMHCLPAHRGEEVTDEVIDGPCSVVLHQAENRLHIQKAILMKFLN